MLRPQLRHLHWTQRVLILWAIESLTFALLILLLPAFTFATAGAAVLLAATIGLMNGLVRPALVGLKLRPNLLVFGVIAIALNALSLWIAGELTASIAITEPWALALIAVTLAAVNVSFSDLFAIDDDESYYQHLVSHISDINLEDQQISNKPGVVFLEIDGLSERILRRAIDEGHMPTLARWEEDGRHRIMGWECDVPCQTSASQAGILLGNNFDVPAFRWFEKDRGKTMVSNRPQDAAELERRLSRGEGLLAADGASRTNLLSGDAPNASFTFSTLSDLSRRSSQDFYPLFMGPYNLLRMTLLFLLDIAIELRAASYQRRQDVRPRVHRGGVYPLLRAATTVLIRELSAFVVIGDMFTGVPSVYTTFVGYDEVAHHSGIERKDAFEVLKDLDDLFDRLEGASRRAPRDYEFVILSDHGQSQGATFKQRYGITLEGFVRELVADGRTVESVEEEDAAWGHVSILLTDLLHDFIPEDSGFIGSLFRRSVERRTYIDEELLDPIRESFRRQQEKLEQGLIDPARETLADQRAKLDSLLQPHREKFEAQRKYLEQVVIGPYRDQLLAADGGSDTEPAEVIVLASGNLGLISFTEWTERMTYEQIQEAFPQLVSGLVEHEGIGFILVHSEHHGPMAIGARGTRYLDDDKVESEDPLSVFGANAARHLKRLDSFPHVADIMVNSLYDPETGEVAAFEELVGSHGGLGGDQMSPFVMFPAEWELDSEEIVGASELHSQLRSWLKRYSDG
ncbi:MAG: phage holin family protein [Anaerolineales bacterium]